MTLYKRIESLRKARKISQGNLEKELGFSNGSISKWKNSTPTPERLQKLAEYFGVSVDWLMTGEESPGSQGYYLNPETAATAQEIFENDKVLFDVYRSADKDRLVEYANKLKALRDMESGE